LEHYVRLIKAASLLLMVPAPSQAAPLQFLTGAGSKAMAVVWLTWGVLLLSLAVIAIISILLAWAIWHRPGLHLEVGEQTRLEKDEGGQNWIWIGVGLSTLALLITVVWTVKVLADIQSPPTSPSVTIEITGKQWWWQVRYMADGTTSGFVTANEIHIPTGQPIRLRLIGGDVIHSFWVPQLGGKMDAIPGQINETWIEASKPGLYTGQCTEYCGVQHSKMLIFAIAQSPADFRFWLSHQLAAPNGGLGGRDFIEHCGNCHAVRGTDAQGSFGPDLSHLMQRKTLASGSLVNDRATLTRWIENPQALKPGNFMPAVDLKPEERARIVDWLEGLN
jgi:cytochrome c oxidase subunit II